VCLNTTGGFITTPTNWNIVGSVTTGTNVTTGVYWRRAASDNQFGSSVVVTHSTFRRTSAVSMVIRGGSTSVDPYGAKSASTSDVTASAALTITDANTLLVSLLGYRTGALSWPITDPDWVEDNAADGGGTNTGARCGHRTSLVNAGAYSAETLWDGSAFTNADCFTVAITSAGASTVFGSISAALPGITVSIVGTSYFPAPPDFNQITDTYTDLNRVTLQETTRDTFREFSRES
jgi:hypothetical protein